MTKRPDPLGDAIRAGGDPLIPAKSLRRVIREHLGMHFGSHEPIRGPREIGSPPLPPHDAVGGKERQIQYWRWSTVKRWHNDILRVWRRYREDQGYGNKRQVLAAKLRRLLEPTANASEGERINARAALQRMGMGE